MATDVDGVYVHWGTPQQERLSWVTPAELEKYDFASGSMGRRSLPRRALSRRPAGRAAIGQLEQIAEIVSGNAGTNVVARIPEAA
jgi:carbamate kinase